MVMDAAPPVILTMEEYRRDWEPQGWTLLIIGPTATWRQEWGEWEAIREVVQNALDEAEAYDWGYDNQGLWIQDDGKGLAVSDFLLGPPKPKPPYARGKFGEGMKIGALALIRKGYQVKVDTVRKEIWGMFLRVKVDGEAEQLAALWRPNGRSAGTRFHIIGYRGPAYDDRFAVNIPWANILHQCPSLLAEPKQRYNQLIDAPFQGRIYARDIFMRAINSPFAYNLWSFELAPDRHAPKSEGDMWVDIGRLWATVDKVDLLERFLGMVKVPPEETADETHNVNIAKWAMGTEPVSGKTYTDFLQENASSWQTAWERKTGQYAVIRTSDRWDGTVRHLGYVPVSVAWAVQDALALVIKTDTALVKESQERLREAQVIPDERLTPRQLAHLKLARKIAERWKYPPVAGVHAAIIPPASDRVRTAGLYGKTTQQIFIASDQLERASTTVDTVIHEIAHHTSGAEDGQEAHNKEMTCVASMVVESASRGAYAEELKAAVWWTR